MLLFNFLKDILYKKQGNLLNNPDNESEFQPYMIQRWLSMYSPVITKLLNNTTNILYQSTETKEDWYKMFLTIIPKVHFKKITYIKRNNNRDKNDNELEQVVSLLAKTNEISKREVREYIKEYNLNIDDIKRAVKEN